MIRIPTEDELSDGIADAARSAVSALFSEHPETFYYCSLITTGEAHPPVLAAWSKESLTRIAAVSAEEHTLKWSYADSPFLGFGESFFDRVAHLFAERPQISSAMSDQEWQAEYELRLRAMESAMARLDREGLFGTGEARRRIVINVEVQPPDYTNTVRAERLNPPDALAEWLSEAAEPMPPAIERA